MRAILLAAGRGRRLGSDMPKRSGEYRHLSRVQIGEITLAKFPLDLRIARQSSSSRAGNVGKDPVECGAELECSHIRRKHLDIGRSYTLLQQPNAVRMKFGGDDVRLGIPKCERSRLAARRRTAI